MWGLAASDFDIFAREAVIGELFRGPLFLLRTASSYPVTPEGVFVLATQVRRTMALSPVGIQSPAIRRTQVSRQLALVLPSANCRPLALATTFVNGTDDVVVRSHQLHFQETPVGRSRS